ncbi:DUF4221 family protein [Algoriphagus sp.]|uniref:DUF4221 family protein n=1 Tax=Algoriphagus sp. TaxID=1872435 RepID=UPI00391B44B4
MRRLAFFAVALITFSCGTTNSEKSASSNVLEDISFTIDTVMVDPGEELINLASGLRLSDLSPDKRTLYLLDDKDKSVSVVDLEELKLLRKLPFEKEGPNGIGQYLSNIQLLPNERFLFAGFQNTGIYSFQGEKVEDIKVSGADVEGMNASDENSIWNGIRISGDEKFLFSLPGNFFEGTRDLVVVDFASKKGKVIDIPAMDITSEFRIVLRSDETINVYTEEISLQELNGKLIIQTTAGSDAYLYDYTADSLRLLTFDHKLVLKKKEGTVRNEVTSQKEFEDEMGKLSSQISFEKFIWDDGSKRYFRFAKIFYPKVDDKTPRKADVFLFAYDQDFKLIGETQLKELTSVPAYPFFKNGKLWSYVNVEDELGFAVIDFKF